MLSQQGKVLTTKVARVLGYSVAAAALMSLFPSISRAAPVNGVVASGAATISAVGAITTIHQATDRAVIDWSSFNLSQNETARFVVPNDTSATLNRISGGLSTISGSVESNGVVYFSNPNGLVFDATSRVSANGFFATTGTISNFDFINRGSFANLGNSSVILNGAISAPSITAEAATVTVGGNLSAGSGKILLSSTNLTTIGSSATISADGGLSGNGGNIKIWSDSHTAFLGRITATGGTNSGDGGFVEVSGKKSLNFSGTVATLAAQGKTGTLLLDPSDITISTGAHSATNSSGTFSSNSDTSIVNVSTLQTELASNNIIIDANAGTGSGSGLITVANDILAATTGSNSLTLKGAQIVINANITMRSGGNLILTASRASVWQDPTKVITANTVGGSSVDGFALGGANKINALGAISHSGTAGILVRNAQALTVNAGTIDGGKGGVMIRTPGFDLTLGGSVAVRGSYLRLDVGGSNRILGGHTLTWSGGDVYYTSAAAGNALTLALGSSNFVFVTDSRAISAEQTITNATALPADFTTAGTGLTITASGTTTGKGLVYGGSVTIDGVTTGAARDLRYIEGADLSVTDQSSFTGSLTLVGSGIDSLGVRVTAGLRTGNGGDLSLVQIGTTLGSAIFAGGQPTAAGALTLTQLGSSGGRGISVSADLGLSAGGNLTLTQVGSAAFEGISVFQSSLNAGGDLSVVLSGTAGSGWDGIALNSFGTGAAEVVAFAAGSDRLVTLKTFHQTLSMNGDDNYSVSGGKLRIDLGKGAVISDAGAYSLKALGMAVYFTGATTGNSAKIAVGSGSFTFVNDRRSVTSAVTLTNSTTEADATSGWGSLPSVAGLTVTGTGDLNGLGVVYGVTVTIDGVGAGVGAGT
ncbi:MAG: filamentous hemagglutinin N-terminal domain-containing protein, partial [Alphaproteobacteria bacterium]|nr:filamentous hemagglutinin N-terminal domain-containing protein [Alphaproteobacteria bacterium]